MLQGIASLRGGTAVELHQYSDSTAVELQRYSDSTAVELRQYSDSTAVELQYRLLLMTSHHLEPIRSDLFWLQPVLNGRRRSGEICERGSLLKPRETGSRG